MKKYRCKICGFIYDDATQDVKFEELPDDWKCPLCGAPKAMFEEIVEDNLPKEEEEVSVAEKEELRELSNYEISYICSNLAKGCEKQYLAEEQNLFLELADYFATKETTKEGSLEMVQKQFQEDAKLMNQAMDVATKCSDSGAKRVLTWASKTSMMIEGILSSYQKEGIDYLKNTKIWVCDICGFVYIGEEPPKVCPVCKVPSFKILEVA